jgi:hypothetical protein
MKIIEPPRRQERQVFRNQNQIIQSSSSLIFLGILAVHPSSIQNPKFIIQNFPTPLPTENQNT